jgi:hypothetical protein
MNSKEKKESRGPNESEKLNFFQSTSSKQQKIQKVL